MQEEKFVQHNTYPLLIVISGPSGVGKDSVILQMKTRDLPFHFVVTATTRAPREGEINGVDYFFVSQKEFAHMIETDELIEYAFVYNDYKGIPKAQVREALDSNRDVVMRIDVQGAATIRRLCPEAILIFLTTRSESELVQRLHDRRTDSTEEQNLRIAMARKELARLNEFDYVVYNDEDKLEETVNSIIHIIESEHLKVHHRKVIL